MIGRREEVSNTDKVRNMNKDTRYECSMRGNNFLLESSILFYVSKIICVSKEFLLM